MCGPAVTGRRISKPGISLDLHVLFPRVVAGKIGLAVAGITRSCRAPDSFPSDFESLDQLAVEPDVQLLRPTHTFNVVLVLTLKADPNHVLARNRKFMVHRDTAARSERQVFALTFFLDDVQRDFVGIDCRD